MPLRLSDLPVAHANRGAVRALLLAAVAVVFVAMVSEVAMAAFLGVVIAVFLLPVHTWLVSRLRKATPAALVTLLLVIVPVLAVAGYGYLEVRDAAEYLGAHTAEVAQKVAEAVSRLPFVTSDVSGVIESGLDRAAEAATGVPDGLQDAIGEFAVAAAMFLFTAFYVLTERARIVAYLRERVPASYAPLAAHLERHAKGVLYGAIYATLVAQTLKALWLLALLLVFGVPLPFTLALLAFVIGFFPVVGSWTIYLPAAGWLLVFDGSPGKAAALVALAFVVSTPLVTFYVRPKLAADRSHVLDFYWMFVGLTAGVFAFGIPGVVLGPVVVGLLKALLDVVTDDESWRTADGDDPEADVLAQDAVEAAG
ncbi:AI-2E family transporter [Rubrivirga marina]|uniref:AI-2E family transporter n=1 Tax=Rubrivirga marina TaxID=1196024 RepID=A0A271J4R4_9BACT|nr:AI-2E family transporter [Rubrivirga marina]PAP77945.1 hypothetical protein BSZ37_16610 [Rubrivirga marina]